MRNFFRTPSGELKACNSDFHRGYEMGRALSLCNDAGTVARYHLNITEYLMSTYKQLSDAEVYYADGLIEGLMVE